MKNHSAIVAAALTLAAVFSPGLLDRAAAQEAADRVAPQSRVAAPPPPPAPAPSVKTAHPAPARPTQTDPPGIVRLYLVDGSIIHGKLTTPEFILTTDFGTLKIPTPLVTQLAPGLDSHPQIRARFNQLIEDLASGDEQKIGKATPQLTRLGPDALDELEAARSHAKSEGVERALQEVIDTIRDADSDDSEDAPAGAPPQVAWQSDDSISTTKFTAVGKLQPQAVQVTTSFGDITIKLSELKLITLVEAPGAEVLVNASVTVVNGGQEAFKSTGISVTPGDKLTFNAKGTLKMTPWDDSINATPEGESDNCGFGLPNIPQGALVGRIGSGPVFKIGSKLTMTADRAGTLKLGVGIEPGMWVNLAVRMKNGEAPAAIMAGQFDVRVLQQPKK